AAVRRATRKAERYEFDRAVDARGLKRSVFVALCGLMAVGWTAYVASDAARAAIVRIVLPFGGGSVATQMKIELLAPQPLPHRMARGEPLDLRLALRGAIPERVAVSVKLDGSQAVDQSYSVPPPEVAADAAELTVRIEPTRIPRDFQFRVRA